MNEHLELARRRYAEIVIHAPAGPLDPAWSRLKVWLADDVCTALDGYWGRPSFRAQAAWPIRTLVPGAATPERGQVEAVDRALVSCAKALYKLASNPPVQAELRRQNPPRPTIVAETHESGLTGAQRASSQVEVSDEIAMAFSQAKGVSERFWTDLVCPNDYLHPWGGWMHRSTPPDYHPGEFVLSFNPSLHAVGDFVTRCFLHRVEVLVDELSRFGTKCCRTVEAVNRRYPAQQREFDRTWSELSQLATDLKIELTTGEVPRHRDSCVILTQVYAAFRPRSDLSWLGLREDVATAGRAQLNYNLTSQRSMEGVDRVAAALGDLAKLDAALPPGQAPIEEAIASHGLVLAEGPTVYWEGKKIAQSWQNHRVAWALLFQLARKAPNGSVHERDVYADVKSASAMAMAHKRLGSLLPRSLKNLIRPGIEKRTYCLDLSRDRVHISTSAPALI